MWIYTIALVNCKKTKNTECEFGFRSIPIASHSLHCQLTVYTHQQEIELSGIWLNLAVARLLNKTGVGGMVTEPSPQVQLVTDGLCILGYSDPRSLYPRMQLQWGDPLCVNHQILYTACALSLKPRVLIANMMEAFDDIYRSLMEKTNPKGVEKS